MLNGKNINSNLRAIQPEYKLAFSVDCVLFGYGDKELKVLLVECQVPPYEGSWSLLGDLVSPDEDLDEAAYRALGMYVDMKDIYLEQVATFGEVKRHPIARVITTAYYALIRMQDYTETKTHSGLELRWFPIDELPEMAFDHAEILKQCYQRLQRGLRESPIGFRLLPRRFTLSQLQNLYEVVLGIELDKRNFRRKLRSLGLLKSTGITQKEVSHRPAKLYHFDHDKYETRLSDGIHFEI